VMIWKLAEGDIIDEIIDAALAEPGRIDWASVERKLLALSIRMDRQALHVRTKRRLGMLVKRKTSLKFSI